MTNVEYDWERFAEIWCAANCVRSGQTGPTLTPSEEHLLCVEFAELHPDAADFLFEKLRDPNPYLAAYAFKCLLRVRDLEMEDIPADILYRTDPIHTLWGCVVRKNTLGNFIRAFWGYEDPEPELPVKKRYLP